MTITIAFDKSRDSIFTLSGLFGAIIRWYTKSNYSHVEMCMADKWIASGNPAGTGVTIHDLRPLNYERWDYYDIEVDDKKFKKIMSFLESQTGTSYDWKGVFFGATMNVDIEDKHEWFCSELVTEVLKRFNVKDFNNINPSLTTPEELYQILKESIDI